jgi:signal transduction histidine kinase
MGRLLAFGLPLLALMAGLMGIVEGLGRPMLSGIATDPEYARVTSVEPGSLAWAAGIRSGDVIVEQTFADDANGWAIVAAGDGATHGLSEGAATATARLSLVPAVVAALLGLAGLASAIHHRRRAELLATIGIVLASTTFAAVHEFALDPLVGAAALLAGPIWLARWTRSPLAGPCLALAGSLLLGLWLASLANLDLVEPLRSLRFDLAALLGIVVVLAGVGVTPKMLTKRSASLRRVDVAFAGSILIAAAAIQGIASPPPWLTVVIAVAAFAPYSRFRGLLASWLDRVIYAEARERATIESAEAERARLSRELHDDPLQSLVGVIMRLEDLPETERERDTLRAVAAQLRGIATALHPPVLDDLGLVPAVETMFSEAGAIPIELELASEAGFGADTRPPFDVELAAYRIIQEAATNAIRHSGCHRIIVRGRVAPTIVAIDVVDDGHGFAESDVDLAIRGGHLGMASMRRRAEAIDAELTHAAGPGGGTTVSLRWAE